MSKQTIRPDIRSEVGETLRLAGPAIVARAGMLLMSIADTVMVGHYATADLAYLGIAWSLSTTLLVANIGLLMGTLVKTSHAFGAGDYAECGRVWRRSMPLAAGVGMVCFALCFVAEDLLRAIGQSEAIAIEGGIVTVAYGAGLAPVAIAVASQFFLEGVKRPIPGMIAMIIANVANLGLNYVMIFGGFGIDAMGAEGAAWATTIARTLLAALAVAFILSMRDRARFETRRRPRRDWPALREQLRIGLATGAALMAESMAFNALTQMAGLIGVAALGAFTATMNLLATVFMAAIGIGVATSVRVGAAWGAGDRPGVERAGWIGLGVNGFVMAILAAALAPVAGDLAGAYGLDEDARDLAVAAMRLSAVVILVDSAQAVLANALRARADVWPTTLIQIACFWGGMLPAAWLFAFRLDMGPAGLVAGIGVGTAISTIVLSIRFRTLGRRDTQAMLAETEPSSQR